MLRNRYSAEHTFTILNTEDTPIRMWMVDPTKMCRQHLLGEHREMHTFVGAMNCGRFGTFEGYKKKGLIDVHQILRRHDELAEEMVRRGYRHKTPMDQDDWRIKFDGRLGSCIDIAKNEAELRRRCKNCMF